MKTCHPRIWKFLESISHIIEDTDNHFGRLREGREINRPRKKKDLKHDEDRIKSKHKLKDGVYYPLEFLKAISHTIGNVVSNQDVYPQVALKMKV